jgi:hypothetical protein
MDVKSLFKSGKKTIKAFKISTGPTEGSKEESKGTDSPLEAFEAPAAAQAAPTVNITASVEEYKAEEETSALKSTVSWQASEVKEAPIETLDRQGSAYVPPSQRRAEASKALPSLAEAVKGSGVAQKGAPIVLSRVSSAAATPAAGGPPRLKLITSASKKAQEEEEKKKEEERKRKDEEKQARKEALKAEMERVASAGVSETKTEESTGEIKAAPLSEIYEKYIGRSKTGRKLPIAA